MQCLRGAGACVRAVHGLPLPCYARSRRCMEDGVACDAGNAACEHRMYGVHTHDYLLHAVSPHALNSNLTPRHPATTHPQW